MAEEQEGPVAWREWKRRRGYWAWFASPEWVVCHIVYRLKGLALFQMLELIGKASVVVGVVVWVVEADNRRQQKHYQAWSVINTARGGTGDGGRIIALQNLNQDGVSLKALSVRGAMLRGIQLPGADLTDADLQNTDRSCPEEWCRIWVAHQVLRPVWPDGQAATAGRLTMGSSPSGAMVSSVM
ncbi:hypothetical protein [Azospirillum thiophilum]|uniref:hypothetical protein n=1 Tax=Azospirillum thiophilum TaxID=528244 RepID=UPI0011875528|nr:hypothetical protein [Azospirillum thiophilum]